MGRFEFDPSWLVIRVLMLLRLARLVGDKVKLAA
jgi:fatty-acid desaturase